MKSRSVILAAILSACSYAQPFMAPPVKSSAVKETSSYVTVDAGYGSIGHLDLQTTTDKKSYAYESMRNLSFAFLSSSFTGFYLGVQAHFGQLGFRREGVRDERLQIYDVVFGDSILNRESSSLSVFFGLGRADMIGEGERDKGGHLQYGLVFDYKLADSVKIAPYFKGANAALSDDFTVDGYALGLNFVFKVSPHISFVPSIAYDIGVITADKKGVQDDRDTGGGYSILIGMELAFSK